MIPDEREGGEELGEVEGRKSVIKVYCMKKIYFSIKEKIVSHTLTLFLSIVQYKPILK